MIYFVLFIGAAILLSYHFVDKLVLLYFMEHEASYKSIGKMLSLLGESQWYIGAGVVGALFFTFVKKNQLFKMRFLFLLYANLFAGLISILLKISFARLRPWEFEKDPTQFGFLLLQHPEFTLLERLSFWLHSIIERYPYVTSFPSGHTTTSVAVCTYFVVLFPRYALLWISITLLSISGRILANDHYVSDVLAGILVGSLSTLYLYSKMKHTLFTEQNR